MTVTAFSRDNKDLIISGDTLFDGLMDTCEGTLGAAIERLRPQGKDLIGITAGHVLERAHEFLIKTKNRNVMLDCKWPPPSALLDIDSWVDWARLECGILEIAQADKTLFKGFEGDVDLYHYSRYRIPDSVDGRLIDHTYDRAKDLQVRCSKGGITVFKDGAQTGNTQGKIVRIRYKAPPSWYNVPFPAEPDATDNGAQHVFENDSGLAEVADELWTDEELEYDFDDDESDTDEIPTPRPWLATLQHNPSFADHGDSGALLYSKVENTKVPIGLWLGSTAELKVNEGLVLGLDCFGFLGLENRCRYRLL
ncbi:hypothetical protein CC80DRAFT_505494 [Byssothecium circinans]|uniref:Uncharacterized protein n=1 Tax=Byssothecium circinans TaxID=147558 RepID=A0A6A5U3A1_9PLEO|nr:hypothetical protein CC80DRAFT_505494 [Byssothecium circinans]